MGSVYKQKIAALQIYRIERDPLVLMAHLLLPPSFGVSLTLPHPAASCQHTASNFRVPPIPALLAST